MILSLRDKYDGSQRPRCYPSGSRPPRLAGAFTGKFRAAARSFRFGRFRIVAMRISSHFRLRDWRIKAAFQAALSRLPGGTAVNEILQRYVGGRRAATIPAAVQEQAEEFTAMLQALQECHFSLRGKRVLEIGTGWDPLNAMLAAGHGADVVTMDVVRHLKASEYSRARLLATYEAWGDKLVFTALQVEAIQRYGRGEGDVPALLSALGIIYHAPVADDFLLTLPRHSFDLIFSIAVFEHVPPRGLKDLLGGQERVLRPHALAYHDAGPGDHAVSFDPGVTYVNFLRYDGLFWRILGESALQYHNRLRASDFEKLFTDFGFQTIWSERMIDDRSCELLTGGAIVPVPRFAGYIPEDLATRRGRWIMRRKSEGKF